MKAFLFIAITLLFYSCQVNEKFDKNEWQIEETGFYPNRSKMLNDLLKNHQLRGLSYKQLIDSLGNPENYSDAEPNTVYYNIVTEYGQIDPVYIKYLIKFFIYFFI